jgi:hypothetical protein
MNKENKSLLIISGLTILLVFISLACATDTSGGNTGNLAATQEALQQTQIALSVEQTLAAAGQGNNTVPSAEATGNITVAPAPQETVENPMCAGKIMVNYQNVSFCYDPALASGTNNTLEPTETSEMSENFNTPQHVQFEFSGYAISPTFHTPVIHVYPVQAYIAISPFSSDVINQLQTLLQNKPEAPHGIPFLPIWNAGQIFSTQKVYLPFSNGEGIRFLTQYGQSYWPINNHDLFYTYQGITADGQYYISAILPISHPELPADGESWPGDLDDLATDFDLFYAENMNILLYSQSDDSFTPTLTMLDEMIQSITITQ